MTTETTTNQETTLEIAGHAVVGYYDGNVFANFVSRDGTRAIEYSSEGCQTALEHYLDALRWTNAHDIVTSSGFSVTSIDGLTDVDEGFKAARNEVVDAQAHLDWEGSNLAVTDAQLGEKNYACSQEHAEIEGMLYDDRLAELRELALDELTHDIDDDGDVQELVQDATALVDYICALENADDEDDEDDDEPPARPGDSTQWVIAYNLDSCRITSRMTLVDGENLFPNFKWILAVYPNGGCGVADVAVDDGWAYIDPETQFSAATIAKAVLEALENRLS